MFAFLFAAIVEPCNTGTTYDLRACWSKLDVAAGDALDASHRRVVAEMRNLHLNLQPLAAATAAWKTAVDKTCAFEYRQYLPGTIAPQLQLECDYRLTTARTERLNRLLGSLQAPGAAATQAPVTTDVDTELSRVYGLYRSRLTPALRAALEDSQRAWFTYRDKACAVEGGTCVADLAKERVAELEASWVGEPFW